MSQWQDIASVPRNGKAVDLGMRYHNRSGEQFFRAPDCYWNKKARRWVCKWHDAGGFSATRLPFAPTHWMARPSPPGSGQDDASEASLGPGSAPNPQPKGGE